MNPRPHSRSRQQGSTLVIAALASGVLTIAMVSFLSYLSNEHFLNIRSNSWSKSFHLAEAGIEVGYAELNYQYYLNSGSGFSSGRGWSNISNVFTKTVSNYTDNTGAAVGNVTITVSNACLAGCNPVIRAVSTCTTTPHGPKISRAIQVQLKSTSQWPSALFAVTYIDMNGNNIYVDSYDSTDSTKSTGGLYDATKRQHNGNIASDGTFMNTINVGNADIYGEAYTGPGGTVALGPGGSIGPTFDTSLRATTVAAGIANGWIESDFNVDAPDPVLPAGASSWAGAPGATGSGIGSIIKDANITSSGSYRVNNITLNSSAKGDTLRIGPNANVTLYVQGDVDISGLGKLLIDSNSSLTVYAAGSVKLAGNGIINNSLQPIKNRWYGLSTSTSWTISGNGQWIGAIYAPRADFTMNGGGTAGDMSGGLVVDTITLNGQVQFHYDEALGRADTGAGYSIVSWQELRSLNDKWVP